MKTLLIIPAYNEGLNLACVMDELLLYFPQYDYIIVNDGSSDDTSEVCRQNGYNHINLPINLGLAGAFQTGMKYAKLYGYDAALQFDGDGQHKAEYIEALKSELAKGNDIVIGSRFLNKKRIINPRNIGNRLISELIYITTGKRISDPTSGMRLYGKKAIDYSAELINFGPEPDTISFFILCKAKVSEVQVEIGERVAGESYLTFFRSIRYMVNMCVSIIMVQWFRKKIDFKK